MRLRLRLAAVLCAVFAALATAVPAAAQLGGGGGLGAPEPQEVVPEPVDPTDDGWAPWQTLLVTGAGIVLIVGIGWVIVGDARRRAPVDDDRRTRRSELTAFGLDGGDEVRHAHRRGAKARARKQQKIARQSRKRNRQRR